MASGSADDALSPALTSFVIVKKHGCSVMLFTVLEFGAIEKKKWVQTFGVAFATARAEGVFLGRGSGQK